MKQFITFISFLLLISCSNYGEKLVFDGTDVYYNEGVTKEQAQKLGNYLVESEFTDGTKKSVQMVKDVTTGNLTFKMIASEGEIEGMDMIFKTFASQLSKDVFNNEPVDFQLCNDTFEAFKTYSFKNLDGIVTVDGTGISYTKNVTKSEAQKLGNYLKESGFTDGSSKTIQLDKEGATYLFRMVVVEGAVNNPESENILRAYGEEISKNAFEGKPLVVHMCDDALKTIKIVK